MVTERPARLRHPMRLGPTGMCASDVFIPTLSAHGGVEYRREACGFPEWMHRDGEEVPEGETEPVLNIQVVECAVCHEQLLNRLFRWDHMPDSTQTNHKPQPQLRMEAPSGDQTPAS